MNNNENCYNNNWLYGEFQWTISPCTNSNVAHHVFHVYKDGSILLSDVNNTNNVRPVVYLKPDIKIIDGNGKKGNNYILEM